MAITGAHVARAPRIRLGMVGGGRDAFIGAVHRIAARIDDQYELVAGCFSSNAEKSMASGADLGVDPKRTYASFAEMAVQAEYAQDWLATDLSGNKQADWRGDPAKAGPGGALGDIATHAFQLAEFVTGLKAQSLSADLSAFVPGRKVDDNVNVLLRFGDARGMLWASQVATGSVNGLKLRVFGDKGGLEWAQETPETLLFTPLGGQQRIIRRGGAGVSASAAHATRIPGGHPEGYLEGFAQIYADAAELVRAHQEKRAPNAFAKLAPGIADGVRGVKFIEAAVASSKNNSAWTALD